MQTLAIVFDSRIPRKERSSCADEGRQPHPRTASNARDFNSGMSMTQTISERLE